MRLTENIIRGRVLIVTAVDAEREAVLRGLGDDERFHVVAAGVGPAAAATGTALALAAGGSAAGDAAAPAEDRSGTEWLLGSTAFSSLEAAGLASPASADTGAARAQAGAGYALVISAGIAGGFAGRAPVGSLVVAGEIVAADLGAETPDGFRSVDELGFGTARSGSTPASRTPWPRECARGRPEADARARAHRIHRDRLRPRPPRSLAARARRSGRSHGGLRRRRRPRATACPCWRCARSPTPSARATAPPGASATRSRRWKPQPDLEGGML